MDFRLVIQFSKPAGSDNWETVAAPVFRTSATEEDVYARVRDLITKLPADTGTGPGQPALSGPSSCQLCPFSQMA